MTYTRLPPKRTRERSGIERGPKRVWPRHRTHVRRRGCSIPGCCGTPIEFAHISTAANSGKGLKAYDWFAISLCSAHHREAHEKGHKTLALKHGVSFEDIAAEFVRTSPDLEMKEAMKAQDDDLPSVP